MKKFTVTIRFEGLAGTYESKVDVEARNDRSARNKAAKTIGNRTGYIVAVCEGIVPGSIEAQRDEEAAFEAAMFRKEARDYKAPEGGW